MARKDVPVAMRERKEKQTNHVMKIQEKAKAGATR
jgi:hypothetical protein